MPFLALTLLLQKSGVELVDVDVDVELANI